MSIKSHQSGDTIVEVVLAMALLSMIIFIAWGTTNRATQISTDARRRITMVNALKEQAEIIKSKYRQADGKLSDVTSSLIAVSSPVDNPCDEAQMTAASPTIAGAYHFETDTDSVASPSTNYRTVDGDDSSRVWFKYVKDADGKYADFYIRGCWLSSGGSQQLENSQFILRLNS